MNIAPQYTIIRRGFPDGREEYRAKVRWGRKVEWLESDRLCGISLHSGMDTYPIVSSKRSTIENHIKDHWKLWISSLPAIIEEEIQVDPESLK